MDSFQFYIYIYFYEKHNEKNKIADRMLNVIHKIGPSTTINQLLSIGNFCSVCFKTRYILYVMSKGHTWNTRKRNRCEKRAQVVFQALNPVMQH